MRLEVEISKTKFFAILGMFLILTGVLGVIAFGGSSPSVVGHSPGEIDWGQAIGKIIKLSGSPVGTFASSSIQLIDSDSGKQWNVEVRGAKSSEEGALSFLQYDGSSWATILSLRSDNNAKGVGINKVNPNSALDVAGEIRASGDVNVGGGIFEKGKALCKEDGSNCPQTLSVASVTLTDPNAVSVYSSFCSGVETLTTKNSCDTLRCQVGTLSGFYDCSGNCILGSASSNTCSNTLVGKLVQ